MYLSSPNFTSIARPLYIDSSTSTTLFRHALAYQLRTAAETELLKQSTMIDVETIYRESGKAFEALSELLGEDRYFFGETKPGLFDASVFAYINVLQDHKLDWKDRRMHQQLKGCENLLEHRQRILESFF